MIKFIYVINLTKYKAKNKNKNKNMQNDNLDNIDILLELEDIKEIETIELNNTEKNIYNTIQYKYFTKQIKKKNSFISWIIFLTKYILTSSMIFAVLLAAANYSAYVDIAKSYIYAWDIKITQQKLISSVEASNIKEKYTEEILKEEKIETEIDSIKKMKKEQDKKNIDLNIEITPFENRIIIPRIWKNVPLLDVKNQSVSWASELEAIFMKELEDWVVRYPSSAKPWEKWTSFIFGHSSNFPWIKWDYNEVFATLDNVVYWDKIIVYYGQKKYTYIVREKKIVAPWDTSVLKRNKNKSEITLMTCWPIWTTLNRLLVIWELVETD